MSQNPNNESSNAPLTEEEWFKFYRLMDSLEKKVTSGDELSKDEADFFEKFHKVYILHMEMGKHVQEINALVDKASGELEKISKSLDKVVDK